ncbi:hypothetical protein [Nocardioides sp. NPDC000441]|uniref:hypothetical protein n=1 Tax=Nocardioides sp. NPDC000441 TaxID=3154256 RepID=UPI003332D299
MGVDVCYTNHAEADSDDMVRPSRGRRGWRPRRRGRCVRHAGRGPGPRQRRRR